MQLVHPGIRREGTRTQQGDSVMAADRVTIYRDQHGCWRWRRQAANGRIIAASGEAFARRWNAARSARRANKDLVIELQAHLTDAEQTSRAFESIGRAAEGLALEGIYVSITATTVEDDETEGDTRDQG
jgi:uncharacterized protein YegP (UPF0339 family)